MRNRVGVFVDAGYFFAQGSVCLAGSKIPRARCQIDEGATARALAELATSKASGCDLLRIYWYDGVGKFGPTSSHTALAGLDNVKVRLGLLNNQGEQKGVDSLIVTDLVELARNGAMSDALVLSGDEDIRIGVHIAQTYGVRVHLLGIHPASGSQSFTLRHEADTITEWHANDIRPLLSIADVASAVAPEVVQAPDAMRIAEIFLQTLPSTDWVDLRAHVTDREGLPSDFDRRMLKSVRDGLGRLLTDDERKLVRSHIRTRVMTTT